MAEDTTPVVDEEVEAPTEWPIDLADPEIEGVEGTPLEKEEDTA